MRRSLLLLSVLVAAFGATTAAASAAIVTADVSVDDGGSLLVVDRSGTPNAMTVTVSGDGTAFVVQEATPAMQEERHLATTDTDDCSSNGPTVTCERTPGPAPTATVLMAAGPDGQQVTVGGAIATQMHGSSAADVLNGGSASDSIQGGGGDDTLRGGAGPIDYLSGQEGADTLDGQGGVDRLAGGPGGDVLKDSGTETGLTAMDTAEYFDGPGFPDDARTAGVLVTLDGIANDGEPGFDDGMTDNVDAPSGVGNGIEAVAGTGFADVIDGDEKVNRISGYGGDDSLAGAGGADYFNGHAGSDTVNARDGGADASIDCNDSGDGSRGTNPNTAYTDPGDPAPLDCSIVNPDEEGGGGAGGDHGGGGPGEPAVKDTTPPETTITGGPSEGMVLRVIPPYRALLDFKASEPVQGYECRINEAAWQACTPNQPWSFPAAGAWVFDVRARDAAGNTDPTPARRTFRIESPVQTGTVKDTRVTVKMPKVTGEFPDAGRNEVLDVAPDVDLEWRITRSCKEDDDYRIVTQQPTANATFGTAQTANAKVVLTMCLADRDFLRDCDTDSIARDLKRFRRKTDAEVAIDVILKVNTCKTDYDVRLAKSAEEAKIGLAAQTKLKKGQVRAAIDCPTGKGNQDLWLVPGGGYNGTDRPGRATFYGLHEDHPRLGWTVPAGPHPVRMTIKILDRAFQTVNPNRFFIDWDDTRKGAPKETVNVANGQLVVNAADLRTGKIRMCAIKETGGEQVLSGALEISVVEKPAVNSIWTDVTGRRLRVGTREPIWEDGGTVKEARARAAQTGIGFVDWLVGLFGGTSRSINAAAAGGGETVVRQKADRIYLDTGASVGQLTMDGTLARSPDLPRETQGECFGIRDGRTFEGTCPTLAPRSQDAMKVGLAGNPGVGSRIVAAGAGNVLSHNGGTIVAAGAGNIVAAGAGNIVAAGAGNIVAAGAGNIVAAGGGNAVPDVARIVAAGGGNLTPSVAAGIVAAGGLN